MLSDGLAPPLGLSRAGVDAPGALGELLGPQAARRPATASRMTMDRRFSIVVTSWC
jgi:hypothetical protein